MLDNKTQFDSDELLDEVLIAEPGYSLPGNFAGLIADKVGKRFAWVQYVKEFLIYVAVIVGIAGVSAGMAFIWFDADWKSWLNFFTSNFSLIVGINFLLLFILFADRVLLRYFMHKASVR